ncbi:MAG: type II toxin-antitoxin system RelE/ParE family toxin [Candidatus Marinimicrobia bacterium]|nr:type II toxin-antitoxin system RelE/ParE family toxin [Candidatus Neomarinimicrobiota bacterium]
MTWIVEYTDQFDEWWESLSEDEQDSVAATVGVLEERGTTLRHPISSGIGSSRHSHMRELRIQHQGDPYRVLYAFDPLRAAILLIGGNKTGNDRWYEEYVPQADDLYDEHLKELKEKDG